MEKPLLKDQNIPPSDEVLEKVLGKSYPVYTEMMKRITDCGLVPQWNYYKDGNAWLCKAGYKKKTVFWLSVWDGYFKTAFYFVERHCSGAMALDIDESIKGDFKNRMPSGKLWPLVINITKKEQITDLLKIVEYKKNLK